MNLGRESRVQVPASEIIVPGRQDESLRERDPGLRSAYLRWATAHFSTSPSRCVAVSSKPTQVTASIGAIRARVPLGAAALASCAPEYDSQQGVCRAPFAALDDSCRRWLTSRGADSPARTVESFICAAAAARCGVLARLRRRGGARSLRAVRWAAPLIASSSCKSLHRWIS